MAAEWRNRVDRLADVLGIAVEVASIPGGFYSHKVAASVLACKIRYLFTSEPTTAVVHLGRALLIGCYALQRGMSPETAAAFAQEPARRQQ